jgi:hypothetical protein
MEYRVEVDDVIEDASGRTRVTQLSHQVEETPEGSGVLDLQSIYAFDGQVTRILKLSDNKPHLGELYPHRSVGLPFWNSLYHVTLWVKRATISDFLTENYAEVTSQSIVREQGRDLLFIEIRHMERAAPEFQVVDRLWFDPACEYALSKAEIWDEPEDGGKSLPRVQFFMSGHVQIAAALWFPSRVQYRDATTGLDREPGVVVTEIQADFEDWVVNPAVSDETFRLEFPKGLLVRDMGQGVTFRAKSIDDQLIAKQVEEARALQAKYATFAFAPVSESWQPGRWLLGVSLTCAAIVCGALYARRRFRTRGEKTS